MGFPQSEMVQAWFPAYSSQLSFSLALAGPEGHDPGSQLNLVLNLATFRQMQHNTSGSCLQSLGRVQHKSHSGALGPPPSFVYLLGSIGVVQNG